MTRLVIIHYTVAMHALNQVINFYMGIVMEKFDDIFVYSTFFYTKLLHDARAVYSWYKGVDLLVND